jgi:hypothetical protein
MDAQMARDAHQMKMAEAGAKIQSQNVKGQLDTQSDFMKLRSERAKAGLDLQHTALKGALDLSHAQQLHDLKMREATKRPNGGSQ